MAARKSSSSTPEFAGSMRIVVLHGPEAFLRQRYTQDYIEALKQEFGDIDEFRYEGEKTEPVDLFDELRSYGLMQQHKLVILDDADLFITPRGTDDDEDNDDDVGDSSDGPPRRKLLERYAENPVDHASLLLRSRTWRPGNLDKLIKKIGGVVVKCSEVNPAQAAGWAIKRCEKEYGCTIERSAASRLVGQIGSELGKLDAELGKLAMFAGPGGSITDAMVKDMVGLSREEKAWAIQEAVLTGNPGAALATVSEVVFTDPRGAQVMLIWSMIDLSRKIHHASKLLRQGMDSGSIGKQLRLWGPSQRLIMQAAHDLDPDAAAQILQKVIDTDQRLKSGRASGMRTVEGLAAFLADTIGRGTYAPM